MQPPVCVLKTFIISFCQILVGFWQYRISWGSLESCSRHSRTPLLIIYWRRVNKTLRIFTAFEKVVSTPFVLLALVERRSMAPELSTLVMFHRTAESANFHFLEIEVMTPLKHQHFWNTSNLYSFVIKYQRVHQVISGSTEITHKSSTQKSQLNVKPDR